MQRSNARFEHVLPRANNARGDNELWLICHQNDPMALTFTDHNYKLKRRVNRSARHETIKTMT